MEREMTMIERVARALTENQMRTANELFRISDQRRVRTEEQIAASIETGWPMNTKDARAAINAMRDPTKEMIMAEHEYDYYNGNAGRLPHEAEEAWGVMIDAALKESSNA